MGNPVKKRVSLTDRHQFDSLPTSSEIEVRPARYSELTIVSEMAHRMIPGVQITEPILRNYFTFDPECILTFNRQEKRLGGIAFLYLNACGHDALIFNEISLTHPASRLLAGPDDEVSAIYMWAIGAIGRGIAGLGNAAAHLRPPRYADADCFAQPSTTAGRDLLIATGFRQIPSFQPDLWCYERPWNRVSKRMPSSPGSFADARN